MIDPEENAADALQPPDADAQEMTVAAEDALTQLLAAAEAVRSRLNTQDKRFGQLERDLQDTAEALLNQIADLEKQSQQAVQALEARSVQGLSALEVRIETAESGRQEAEKRVTDAEAQVLQERKRQDVYKQAWQSAPLTLRLKFVRELLPGSHSLQNVLKEAAALEDLRRRGHDLEAWLSNYPALFADAAQALLTGGSAGAPESSVLDTHPAEVLAVQTLQETQAALETTLQALGVAWVAPAPGDPVLPEHEVTGEEISAQGTGRVARLRRRGFRFQGRLALPAQVVRAAASPAATMPALSEHDQATDAPTAPQPAAEPDWLRMLSQRTFGCRLPAVSALAERVFALQDLPARIAAEPVAEACALLTERLQPLLPLLGLRYEDGLPDIPSEWGAVFLEVQKPLLAWLAETLGLSVAAPLRGDGFDARTMQALETRRTVHAKENETVAKLERIGIVWRERPLILAQVARYTTGGIA